MEYGPFDYEWSQDFCGVELLYRGQKFGEVCGEQEIFADLKEFHLPMTVVKVASVVFGSLLHHLRGGLNPRQREVHLSYVLDAHGCGEFQLLN